MLQQIIRTIKIRSPTRHDTIDLRPIWTNISNTIPLSVVAADKGYDSEENMFWLENYYMDLALYLLVRSTNCHARSRLELEGRN